MSSSSYQDLNSWLMEYLINFWSTPLKDIGMICAMMPGRFSEMDEVKMSRE